jgi:hypothetical protein
LWVNNFDNTDDIITISASATIKPQNNYTALFWQKSSALTDYVRPFSWDKGDSKNRFFVYCYDDALQIINECDDVIHISQTIGSFTNWTMVSVTLNSAGNYASFALNGAEGGNDTAYSLADFSSINLLLGTNCNTQFWGWRILTTALSTTQLTSIYQQERHLFNV